MALAFGVPARSGSGWRRARRVSASAVAVAVVVPAAIVVGGFGPAGGGSAAFAAQPPEATDGVAQTELEARVEAAASGEPVEVLAFRNEQRDVTAYPDGTLTVRQYVAPVRTIQDGEWVAPDPTLAVRADGRLAPAAALLDMSFSGGGEGPLVRVAKAGRGLSIRWQGALPEPVLDGAAATYPEVLPGVDLVVVALVDGFSHTLVVKNAQAAANPALAAIDMPVAVDGAEVRVTDAGGVEVVDAGSGGVMLAADAPMMWDSGGGLEPEGGVAPAGDGEQQRAQVAVSVEDDALTLVPDAAVLTGVDTTYPVYIDPVYRDEFRSAWAMVDSGFPSEEYWKFDGKDNEGLGRCPPDSGVCNSSLVKRLFYRLPTSFYDGKEILSAQFVAVLKDNWAHANVSDQANLHLTSSFTTTTNWGNQPSGSLVATANPPAPSGDCSGLDDGGTEWDVTPELRDAADDGRSTLTFGLRNATESDSTKWMRFCDDAYLQVRYNTPPLQPKVQDLSISPGASCSYALTGDSFINRRPTLRAFLFDPDHGKTNEWNGGGTVSEQLRAEFRLTWGSGSSWTAPLTSAKASGSRFTLDLAIASGVPSLPNNTPISWIVRAYDGHHFSPWSNAGEANPCRFVIDPTAPAPPTITSTDFPDDDTWADMLGTPGVFTLSSTSSDVVSYAFDFTNDPFPPTTKAADADGTATIVFTPSRAGPHVLTVQAFDNASNSSVNSYSFAVSARGPVGSWNLADPVGASQAAGADGSGPATAGPGVSFGVAGPGANTAAQMAGTTDGWLQAADPFVLDEGGGFAVSAWVRTTDLTRDQTAVSVDDGGTHGFALGYSATSRSWRFEVYNTNQLGSRFTFRLGSPANAVETGEWAHLAAVSDPASSMMRLYVNGTQVSEQRRARWSGQGVVRVGTYQQPSGYTQHWDGDLAEVRVFDRAVFAEEITALASLAPLRQAYWQLNDAENDTSPEYGDGPPLTLNNGAVIYQMVDPDFDPEPLVGAGHLMLDGADGYAATGTPIVDTGDSFTVTARVRLGSVQPSVSMSVLSVSGANRSMFVVRYSIELDAWQLELAHADAGDADVVSATSPVRPSAGVKGQLLAVVYNAFTDQVTLYVDGVASAPLAEPFDQPWSATGGLQVGRSLAVGGYGEYLSAEVDEVRAYAGAADAATIQRIGNFDEQPAL